MATAAELVKRFKAAGEGAPGVGTGKAPREILMVLKRVFPGIPEYNALLGTESPHLFSYKSDARFSVNMTDLKMLLRNGLMRMQVNNPGHITLYFGPTGAEAGPVTATVPSPEDFFRRGQAAFAEGLPRVPAQDRVVMQMLKGTTAANTNLGQWLKGWDRSNINAPVT